MSGEPFSSYLTPSSSGGHVLLTEVTSGAAANGNEIQAGTNDISASAGVTGANLFEGGAGGTTGAHAGRRRAVPRYRVARCTRRLRVVAAVAICALILAACGTSAAKHGVAKHPAKHHSVSLPRFGLAPCVGDSTSALNSYFAGLSSNTTVTLPHDGCFNVTTGLSLANKTGLTINGNWATIHQTVAGTGDDSDHPILFLTQDTNLKISNLSITGLYNGSNGGDYYEGKYGIELEGDTNVLLTGMTVENIQGDCLLLQSGNDITPSFAALNVNVTATQSTFDGCGYHGLTVEAADDFNFSYNKITNVGLDAMDFEVDGANTYFINGDQPQGVAEDNITIANNTWTNWSGDWFASLQGQTPGVQEQNLMFRDNTLNGTGSGFFNVVGTNTADSTEPWLNYGMTITGNHGNASLGIANGRDVPGYFDYQGGLDITDNSLNIGGGAPDYLDALAVIGARTATVKGNTFYSAAGSVYAAKSTGDTNYTQCGNHYGINGATLDSSC